MVSATVPNTPIFARRSTASVTTLLTVLRPSKSGSCWSRQAVGFNVVDLESVVIAAQRFQATLIEDIPWKLPVSSVGRLVVWRLRALNGMAVLPESRGPPGTGFKR